MEKQSLPPEMTEVLKTGHFAYLCTTDKENQPHITPTFFAFDAPTNNFYVMTSSDSKKLKNLQVNSKVSLSIDIRDPTNPFNNRGVMVQGKATVDECIQSNIKGEDKELISACDAYQRKYPVLLREAKFPVAPEYEKFSEALIRIVPEKMMYWRGPNFITINFSKRENIQRLI